MSASSELETSRSNRLFGINVTAQVELLKTELGYDDGFNYKKEKDLDAALTKYAFLSFDNQLVCLWKCCRNSICIHQISEAQRIDIYPMWRGCSQWK